MQKQENQELKREEGAGGCPEYPFNYPPPPPGDIGSYILYWGDQINYIPQVHLYIHTPQGEGGPNNIPPSPRYPCNEGATYTEGGGGVNYLYTPPLTLVIREPHTLGEGRGGGCNRVE